MNHELLAQIIVFAFAMFAALAGIGSILRYQDRKRFIARLTESSVTRVETEQPGFRPINMAPVDSTDTHWKAGTGPACSGYMDTILAEAIARRRLHNHGVEVGNVLIGGHGLPFESEMERERR